MFAFLKRKSHVRETAAQLYLTIVAAARRPFFYREMGVPDTTDGRFEMIVLCGFFVFEGLRRAASAGSAELAQQLFDLMFMDMDQSLREMGVGDLGVPRHMKRMMTGFNGRITAYGEAVAGGDAAALEAALKRNVYGTVPAVDEEKVKALVRYVMLQSQAADAAGAQAGEVVFLDPEMIRHG